MTGERIGIAVRTASGRVERARIKLSARDVALREIVVFCQDERGVVEVIRSLGNLDGISVVGVEDVDGRER